MASGLVAKKIALFEIKPSSTLEQQCRLKRKHAIRRKKYRGKERRIVTHEGTSMIALSTSDEHLNQLKDSDEDHLSQRCSNQFSASCSALFDLVSVESSESGITVDDKTHMEIIPRSKRVILKSGSVENFSKRLNIIDIDIEIKIEKKEQRSSSSPPVNALVFSSSDQYEPLEVDNTNISIGSSSSSSSSPSVAVTDRIRLSASVDDSSINERSSNYYCSKCSHDAPINHNQLIRNNNNRTTKTTKASSSIIETNSPEPLYENIFSTVPPPPMSLGAPPLPPKRLFGDSFTTNYSCLPAASTRGLKTQTVAVDTTTAKNKDIVKGSSNEKKASFATYKENDKNKTHYPPETDNNTRFTIKATIEAPYYRKRIEDQRVTDGNSLISTTASTNVTTKDAATCSENEDEVDSFGEDQDEEPFYEDLYDYCNGSENGIEGVNPLLELFRDQLHSLEQNVEDEVEYCDCSTILALMKPTDDDDPTVGLDTTTTKKMLLGESYSFDREHSLRSYEIYDDCCGVDSIAPHGTNEDDDDADNKSNNNNKNCDISNDDDIGCLSLTKSSAKNSTTLPKNLFLSDYINSKVTKASTPPCRKVSSSELTQVITPNVTKPISSSSSSRPSSMTASDLHSAFPSLSISKTKLVEPKGGERGESIQNEASSSPQVIAENERNVSKSKLANNHNAYGILKNSNGNNKPRFGGRLVIAHPIDGEEEEELDEEKKFDGNDEDQSEEYLGHKRNKKDDNEIFNKPLPLPPSNASAYESVYEEPLYGITNKLTATYSDNGRPGGASPGKRRSSAPAAPFLPHKLSGSKPGSTYSHSPSVSSGSTYGYSSGSVNEYGESGSASKYGPSSCQTVVSSCSTTGAVSPAADGMSIYGISDKLPPTPPSKFSSIAKTAGRKIAKKFLGIRKTSKSSLDDPQQPSSFDSSNASNSPMHLSQLQESKETTVTNSNNNEKIGGNCSGTQIRRPISRPSIPPPEPPKNEYGSPPASIGTSNNYSIYESKNDRGTNEDDFDDSDFYDSDSELIRNFVSQVQPIYSMEEEPLYQYYTYGISLKPDDDYQPVIPKNLGLTLDMLVPRVGQRTLWCELPGVVSSGILSILSDKQKQLQEAIFEVLTSEVSYLKSLDVLISLFYKNEELIGVLTEEERGHLFGNIEDVRDCSQAFLSELLAKWEESWYIQEIGDIIIRNTETRFSVYKEYCRNKPYQDKTMQKLRHTRDEFVSVVKAIEEDGKCQMLQVDSFLMLPMQRITRLPLLVNAVIQRTAAGKEKNKCEEALKCLTNLVLSCNDAARESQDAEETMAILEKLEFTRGIRSLPDLGPFIMKGDFMKNPFDQGRGNQINWTFRKAKRQFYWLLLFSKQLLVARRKANGRFEIIDMTDPLDSHIKALPNLEGVSKDFKHFFMLHFNRKETVYFLSARTNSEVERWKSKLDTLKPKEELRVEAIFPYDARRPDEMSFYVGDIIRVSQMQPDGWYFGTKLKSGESGWFPGNYCCENAT